MAAHIIPRAFIKPLMKGQLKQVVIELSPEDPYHKRELQSGIFDRGILCGDCDRALGELDAFGVKYLRKQPDIKNLGFHNLAYDLGITDISQLKRFFLSIMWRASVTSQKFFQTAKLEKEQELEIQNLIESEDTIPAKRFECLIFYYFDAPIKGGFSPPWICEFEGIKTYNLYLPFYTIRIRIDPKSWPEGLSKVSLGQVPRLQCLRFPFSQSLEEQMQNKVISGSLRREFGRRK